MLDMTNFSKTRRCDRDLSAQGSVRWESILYFGYTWRTLHTRVHWQGHVQHFFNQIRSSTLIRELSWFWMQILMISCYKRILTWIFCQLISFSDACCLISCVVSAFQSGFWYLLKISIINRHWISEMQPKSGYTYFSTILTSRYSRRVKLKQCVARRSSRNEQSPS